MKSYSKYRILLNVIHSQQTFLRSSILQQIVFEFFIKITQYNEINKSQYIKHLYKCNF